MRKLAHIEKIKELIPIYLLENDQPADNIELARVLGWEVVVKKGEYKPGDYGVYIEIDSIAPQDNEVFGFLANKKFKIKTMKLNKFYYGNDKTDLVVSQGLLMQPSEVLPELELEEGLDVTELLKITKIEDETPEIRTQSINQLIKTYQKHHWFLKTKLAKKLMAKPFWRKLFIKLFIPITKPLAFPSYIPKTDETRVQNLPQVFEVWQGKTLQVTEKLDGTSSTYGLKKLSNSRFDYAVCSRNVRQVPAKQKNWHNSDINYYWEMSSKYDIERLLYKLFNGLGAKDHVILQGETIGPSIQSNRYYLNERKLYAFNLIVDSKKIDTVKAKDFLKLAQDELGIDKDLRMEWVPILDTNYILPTTIHDLLKYATANSKLHDSLREGIVLRDQDNKISFKAVSPEWLLKHKL